MNYKYILKRFIAYVIDLFIVISLVMAITETKILNPMYEEQQQSNELYNNYITSYYKMNLMLDRYYEDKKISEEEYNDLYNNNIYNYLLKENMNEEDINIIKKEVKKDYDNNYKYYYYDYMQGSIYYNIMYIIVFILYFVGFNIITKGVSLGKKICKLKIVSINNKDVSIIEYLIRSVILYSILFYIIKVILILLLSKSDLLNYLNVLGYIQSGVELVVMLTILYCKDSRGIHDKLSNTKVISTVGE